MNRNSWDLKEELLQTFHIQEEAKTLWSVDKGIKKKNTQQTRNTWVSKVMNCIKEEWDWGCSLVLQSTRSKIYSIHKKYSVCKQHSVYKWSFSAEPIFFSVLCSELGREYVKNSL